MSIKPSYLIRKFGQDITIKIDEAHKEEPSKAIIQPLRWDAQSALYQDYLTENITEQFLYIGPPELELSKHIDTAIITANGQRYTLKMAEYVRVGNEVMYERAVMEKSN